MKKIRDQLLPQITITQLNNYKSTLKKKTKSGLNELLLWCENHSEIPVEEDVVFVGDFDYELGIVCYDYLFYSILFY